MNKKIKLEIKSKKVVNFNELIIGDCFTIRSDGEYFFKVSGQKCVDVNLCLQDSNLKDHEVYFVDAEIKITIL